MKQLTVEWLAKELLLYDKEWQSFTNEHTKSQQYYPPSLDDPNDLLEYTLKAKDVFELKEKLPINVINKALEEDIELPNFVYDVIQEIKDLVDFIQREDIYLDQPYFVRLKNKYESIYNEVKKKL